MQDPVVWHREKALRLFADTPPPMTTFEMWRGHDEGGLALVNADNNEGKVLEGIVFSDGAVAVHWTTKLWSVTFYPDWATFVAIHIDAHPTNHTVVTFSDGGRWSQAPTPYKRVDANIVLGSN